MPNSTPATTGGSFTVAQMLKWALFIDCILAALVATNNSLLLTLGGEAIGASAPATTTAAILGWIANFVITAFVQGFIMLVAGIIGMVFIAVGSAFVAKNRTPGENEKSDRKIARFVKWGLTADFLLAALIASYSAVVQYGLLSATHANETLNLISAILSGILLFGYAFVGIAFFMTIFACIIGVIAFVLSGGMNKKTDVTSLKKD